MRITKNILALILGSLGAVFILFYGWLLLLTMMSYTQTYVVTNTTGQVITVQVNATDRKGNVSCMDLTWNGCDKTIGLGKKLMVQADEDRKPLSMKVTESGEETYYCFNRRVDNKLEQSFGKVIETLLLRGNRVFESNFSQHEKAVLNPDGTPNCH